MIGVLAQFEPRRPEPHELPADGLMFDGEAHGDIEGCLGAALGAVRLSGRSRRALWYIVHPASFALRSSLSCAGFALPPVAFITWPTKNPNSLSLPER